jgi:acyl-CoA dehydrogenase
MNNFAPPHQKDETWIGLAHELGAKFADRAADNDACDRFAEQNLLDLKKSKLFSAQVPVELGGGGASYREICEFLRVLAQYCGSTALTFSMHNHLLAALVWRWRNQKAPVEALLKRVVDEQLVLVSTGGSDWLNGSAKAEKVDGGYTISGQKIFASGSPLGDLMMTMAVFDDPKDGPTVMHLPISMKSPGVKILNTWEVMGMRATGSNDIELKDVFVADSAVAVRRPQGKWHPSMHLVVTVAFPVFYSPYLGIAESARDIAVRECARKRDDRDVQQLVGEMEMELSTARLAWDAMVTRGATATPGEESTKAMMMNRALLARAAITTVEKAMEAVGGRSFYRSLGLERRFRDIQAARYHPLPAKPLSRLAGRLALGLPIDE